MKIYTINEAGKAEVLKQNRAIFKNEVTEDLSAYSDDFLRLSEKAAESETPEIEIGGVHTKSGQPEFITLNRDIHFSSEEVDESEY